MTARLEGSSWQGRGASRFGLALVVAVGLLPILSRVHAQEADGVYYLRQRNVPIPVTFDPNDKRAKQAILHVSEDQGRTYQSYATLPVPGPNARPEDKLFQFTARKDGWYWFAIQVQDFDGTLRPPNLNTVQPGLKVCVDTEPPLVTLDPVAQPRDGTAGVTWNVRDENLKMLSLRLEYRMLPRTDWIDLEIQKMAASERDWTPNTTGEIEVRLTAQDFAGNTTVKTTRLTPGGIGGGAGATVRPIGPIADAMPRGRVKYVNKRKIKLNYKIDDDSKGPSGVSSVEVWYTFDAKKWTLYSKNGPENSPFVVEMAGEGRYGFTLVARSGVGLGDPPPAAGDEPQLWVEVDETPPQVKLVSVEVGRGPDSGTMKILWTATDKFMTAQPITISYAEAKDGGAPLDWKPIAAGIANDGKYVWKMPEKVPYKLYIKVEAVDEAHNIGKDETRQPVIVDLKLPKVTSLDADPADK
jgi:hypothetical protein